MWRCLQNRGGVVFGGIINCEKLSYQGTLFLHAKTMTPLGQPASNKILIKIQICPGREAMTYTLCWVLGLFESQGIWILSSVKNSKNVYVGFTVSVEHCIMFS